MKEYAENYSSNVKIVFGVYEQVMCRDGLSFVISLWFAFKPDATTRHKGIGAKRVNDLRDFLGINHCWHKLHPVASGLKRTCAAMNDV